MSKRLMNLNPQFRAVHKNFTPETGGEPTGIFELSFTCPVCGPPTRCSIKVGPVLDEAAHIWSGTPMPPDGATWPDRLTVSPSIGWETVGHGRHRPPCTWHGHIINGEVLP